MSTARMVHGVFWGLALFSGAGEKGGSMRSRPGSDSHARSNL